MARRAADRSAQQASPTFPTGARPIAAKRSDNAVLRVKGVEICLAWKQFGGGGGGCYPVSEEAAGRYPAQHRPALVRHQPEII